MSGSAPSTSTFSKTSGHWSETIRFHDFSFTWASGWFSARALALKINRLDSSETPNNPCVSRIVLIAGSFLFLRMNSAKMATGYQNCQPYQSNQPYCKYFRHVYVNVCFLLRLIEPQNLISWYEYSYNIMFCIAAHWAAWEKRNAKQIQTHNAVKDNLTFFPLRATILWRLAHRWNDIIVRARKDAVKDAKLCSGFLEEFWFAGWQ